MASVGVPVSGAKRQRDEAAAMAAAAREYAQNAPTWNFVQGNLIAENRFLRKALPATNALWAMVVVVLLFEFYGVAKAGGVRIWAVPESKDGAVVGQAAPVAMTSSPTTGEIVSRLKELVAAGFSASVQPSVNRERRTFVQAFTTDDGFSAFQAYYAQENGAYDPFRMGSEGRFVDVTPTKIQPLGRGAYDVAWRESVSDRGGKVIEVVAREAVFTVVVIPKAQTLSNPYGVYVTSFHLGSLLGGTAQ